jgi:creatinine amidohydrolase
VTKRLLAHLTSAEARERLAARPVILVPLGSHEDQGPHAPMGDFLLADALALAIAERAAALGTDTLVAPIIPYGVAAFFGHAPGAIALSAASFKSLLSETLDCLLAHGQTRLVILNGHGENVPAIHEVTLAIRKARGIVIPSFYPWRIAGSLLPAIVGPETARATGGHGGDPLTSIGLSLSPALMRPDLLPTPRAPAPILGLTPTGLGTARFEDAEIQLPLEFDEAAPGGSLAADVSLCSAATGAALLERLTALGARFVAHHAAATA